MNLAWIVEPHPDDSVALISRGRTTTYGTLHEQVAAYYRGGLARLGLEPGDRVGIIAGTNWYFVAYYAILGGGYSTVPLNPLSPARELERELAAVGARAVVVGPSGRAGFGGVDRSKLPALEHVIATGDGLESAIELDELLKAEPTPIVDRGDDDLAVLVFTSGTAGSPKAAMLTHGNLRSNLEQVQAHPGRALRSTDVLLGVLPLFHIFGLNVVLAGANYAGASIVLIERFDPVSALEAMARHGVTVVLGAPTMWAAWAGLLPGAEDGAFRSVRLAGSGAAPLDLDVAATVKRTTGVVITEGYGLTEASPVVTSSAGTTVKPGSIGVPLPGVEVRLVDPQGDDVLVGDAGELWVRGPNVFPGYWEDEAATAAAITPEGWLRTGDVAVVDDDGHVFLVDRAKDIIIVSGFNVFPAEVEDVLLEHPAIGAAAVVGVAHPYSGEAVKAYVVVRDGRSIEEDEVIAFCADHLARYKCPDKVMFVDEIPTGVTGKVLRRALVGEPEVRRRT